MTKTETAKKLLRRVCIKTDRCEYYEIDGKKDGEYKVWRSNGQLYIHCFYKNDKLDGESKHWHDNGQLFELRYFKNGRLDGELKRWDKNGQLLERPYRKNDVGVKI